MFLVAVRRYVRFLKILKLRPVVKIDPKRHIPILTGRQVLVLNGSPHEMVLTLPLSVSDGPYLNKILNCLHAKYLLSGVFRYAIPLF